MVDREVYIQRRGGPGVVLGTLVVLVLLGVLAWAFGVMKFERKPAGGFTVTFERPNAQEMKENTGKALERAGEKLRESGQDIERRAEHEPPPATARRDVRPESPPPTSNEAPGGDTQPQQP